MLSISDIFNTIDTQLDTNIMIYKTYQMHTHYFTYRWSVENYVMKIIKFRYNYENLNIYSDDLNN